MGKPFKETPILEGKDAETFLVNLAEILKDASSGEKQKEKEAELKRMKESFDFLSTISNDVF